MFVKRVANPKDLVSFHRRRVDKDYKFQNVDVDCLESVLEHRDYLEMNRVEDAVKDCFKNLSDGEHHLMLLTEQGFGDAVQEYVDKNEQA
ncbi:Uncharacterised protein r2_g948 [Pycnogonum litorale]